MAIDILRRRKRCLHRGASFLEFLGYISAMAGGVVIGSMYLGVDVKRAALGALETAGLAAPETGASQDELAAEATPDAADSAEGVEDDESASVADQAPAPVEQPSPAVEAVAVAEAPRMAALLRRGEPLTDEQRHELTHAYWTAVEQCMQDEVAHRTQGLPDADNLQLFDYLSHRDEGHRTAAERIAEISNQGVDPHVTAYAETARRWHAEGAKLFSRAVDLLTDAPTAQLSGPFAQSWQSAATQHRMEERLLGEKRAAVQSWLNHAQRAAEAAAASSP